MTPVRLSMNLALWLERAGKADPQRPALGIGPRVLRTYGEVAGRVARLAGALRGFGLEPGDRVAIAAKNCPDYVEMLYAIWHAGLAAVPANAKLHGAELGYILEQSGARVCFASDGLDGEIAPHAPQESRAADRHRRRANTTGCSPPIRSRSSRATATISPGCSTPRAPPAGRRARCSPTACWRPRATPTAAEVDPLAPGDPIVHAAPMSHGSGLYIMPHVMRARRQRRAGIRRLRAGGDLRRCSSAWPRSSMFAAPTMVKRLVESPRRMPERKHPHHRLRRRADVCRGRLKALDRFGPRLAQIYGQGESPMTITTLSREDIADRDHPRWLRAAGLGRPALRLRRGAWWPTRTTGRCRPARPARSSCRGDIGDGGLLAAIPRPARRRCAAAGCTPAMSAPSTRTAF